MKAPLIFIKHELAAKGIRLSYEEWCRIPGAKELIDRCAQDCLFASFAVRRDAMEDWWEEEYIKPTVKKLIKLYGGSREKLQSENTEGTS